MTLPELLAEVPPWRLGSGELSTCEGGATSLDALEEEVGRYILLVKDEQALSSHSEVLAALPCLQAPMDPEQVARFWQGRGHLLFSLEEEDDEARQAFRQAGIFDPTLAWGASYDPKAAPMFYEERDRATESIPLTIKPELPELVINGRPPNWEGDAALLAVGLHLIQWQGGAVLIEVSEADTLFLPGALPAAALQDVAVPERWQPLHELTVDSLPADERAFAVVDERLFSSAPGDMSWSEHKPLALPRSLLGSGAGLLLVGGTTSGIGALLRRQAVADGDQANLTLDSEQWSQGEDSFQTGGRLTIAGAVTASAGAVVMGTGLVIGQQRQIALSAGPLSLGATW